MKQNDKDSKPAEKKMSIHAGHRQRLRERFEADSEMLTFADHEMLEFILSAVIPRKDTNEIAHELIAKCGSMYSVLNEPIHELLKVKNMTVGAAYLLASFIPIMRKCLRLANGSNMKQILNYGDAADFFHTFFLSRNTECLSILYMDVNFRVAKTEVVDELDPTSVGVNVRTIIASAIKVGAVYVMIGHNHPSGSPIPSENDLILIWKLFNSLKDLSITLLDNFIFTSDGFLSFRNVGILDKFLTEYTRKNPNTSLHENTKHTSLYLSNLKQYLIDVTKLNENNLVELVTIQEFIDNNKLSINDYRHAKESVNHEKNAKRKPISKTKFKLLSESSDDLPISSDAELLELEKLIKRAKQRDMHVYNRNKLTTIDIDDLFTAPPMPPLIINEVINEEQRENAILKANERRRDRGVSEEEIQEAMENPDRISASSRNIPVYVDIPEDEL